MSPSVKGTIVSLPEGDINQDRENFTFVVSWSKFPWLRSAYVIQINLPFCPDVKMTLIRGIQIHLKRK